jgi:hypothetical protein
MPQIAPNLRPELSVLGCDTTALVEVSKQFAEFEFEAIRRNELSAAQVAADKADWSAIGASMGIVYQSLCDGENEKVMGALHTIETILMRHGILVPQPTLTPVASEATPEPAPLPIQEEVNYGE